MSRTPRSAAFRSLAFVSLLVACAGVRAMPAPSQETDDWPDRVLLVNDDGIDSPGLAALARAFAEVAETWVVAPSGNRSGSGTYMAVLGPERRIVVEPHQLGDGIRAYAISGYPADAVAFGVRRLLADSAPDLVVSGINAGPNLGEAWLGSGTIGAARIAAYLDVPAISVSGFDPTRPETTEAVARWVVDLARSAAGRELARGEYLTVSVPLVPASQITGVEVVRRALDYWRLDFEFVSGVPQKPRAEVWRLNLTTDMSGAPAGTDLAVLRDNRIAIVPMELGENDRELAARLLRAGAVPTWSSPDR